MSVYELFRTLYRAGVVVLPAEDGGIDAEGPLTDPLRELIRNNTKVLRAELNRQQIGERDDYPSPLPRRYVVPPYCRVKDTCHRLGACGPPATCTSCAPDNRPSSHERKGNNNA